MVIAFAPLVGLLLGISAITVPWATLLTSVVLYIVIPVILAQILRKSAARERGKRHSMRRWRKSAPGPVTALLATLVLLFAFQGEAILKQPLVIVLLAIPILIQVFLLNSALAYWLNRAVGEKHNMACPWALIGASNFFELAVATAIGLFGFNSGATLATVVGVLIEVPAMLLVVRIVNRLKRLVRMCLKDSEINHMSNVIIYHSPDYRTSRNALAMISNAGIEPTIIEYLKHPPSRETPGRAGTRHKFLRRKCFSLSNQ